MIEELGRVDRTKQLFETSADTHLGLAMEVIKISERLSVFLVNNFEFVPHVVDAEFGNSGNRAGQAHTAGKPRGGSK
jgi:hypothetical protein